MFKKLLSASVCAIALAAPALAADLAPVPPPPPFTWTGFYLGGQIGYGWGEDSSIISIVGPLGAVKVNPLNGSGSTQLQGAIGGAHIGYDWQIAQFVLGLEGQVDGATISKTTTPVNNVTYAKNLVTPYTVNTVTPVQGAFLGRVGYAIDRTLLYVVGGGGYGWIKNKYTIFNSEGDFSTTRAFWTVGAGIEYGITQNWFVRAEYRHSDFGYFRDGPIVYPQAYQSHSVKQNEVQVGFSYKFISAAPAPVVAKY
jgi:outer membrane immunogenic protein